MTILKDKVAIVTGASSGIGRAAAELFAGEGAAIVLSGRRQDELDQAVRAIKNAGGRAVAVAGDVRSEAHAKELVDVAVKEFGGLDIAFNNAGSLPGGTDTPSNTANVPGAAPETRGFIEGLHALKRLGRPEEIAEAALFLASAKSGFVTGTALFADGGVSITRT